MEKERKPKGVRQLTMCNKRFDRAAGPCVSFPSLVLGGKWLQDTGFKTGYIVDVACEEGKLVITLAKEQRWIV